MPPRRSLVNVLALVLAAAGAPRATAAGAAAPAGTPELRLTVGEAALGRWLDLLMPLTIRVGNDLVSADLVFSEPREVALRKGVASLRLRVTGRTLPIDQTIAPAIRVEYDPVARQYYGVVASLPIQLPGLGRIDLKDSLPRLAVPPLLEDLFRFEDRSLSLNLRIRTIAILDRAIEVGADTDFAPLVPAARAAGP